MWRLIIPVLLIGLLSGCAQAEADISRAPAQESPDEFTELRMQMVNSQIREGGVLDEAVLAAMRKVHRHRFVPVEYTNFAYSDTALPIGYGQTISQPYIVALMTEYLALQPGDKVLEIGTGSGYQAAVLAEITDQVYSVEIIELLAQRAADTLKELGYNVQTKADDGYYGWEEHAPFDAIIVTAAPDHMPQPLINQLVDGGRLIIPVGPPGLYQTLWLVEKKGDQLQSVNLGGVTFVPLTGEH